MRRASWNLAIVCGFAIGCASGEGSRTEMAVVVWSDLVVPTEMDNVHVEIKGASDAHSLFFQLTEGTESGKTQLPIRFSLVPSDTRQLGFDVNVTGFLGNTTVVAQAIGSSCILGERRLLTIFLGRACKNVACGQGFTCSNGTCIAPAIPPSSLPVYDPSRPLLPPDARIDEPFVSESVDGSSIGPDLDAGAIDMPMDTPNIGVDSDDSSLKDVKGGDTASDQGQDVPLVPPDSRDGEAEGIRDMGTADSVDRPDAPVKDRPDATDSIPGACGEPVDCTNPNCDSKACIATESCGAGVCTRGVCQVNGPLPAGTVCRPTLGACDIEEKCDGTTIACPEDAFAPNTTVCRPASGLCDLQESCSGTSTTCPADGYVPSSIICRPAAGPCDVAESCTGSNAACPSDVYASSMTICRASAGVCDVAESCTGSSEDCPPDVYASSTTICRASAGVCDVAESCTGSSANCPADGYAPTTTVCRPVAGGCDLPESCTGAGISCPADKYIASGEGTCPACQHCSGSSAGCVNLANNSQDNEGSNLCTATCMKCSSGMCVPQTSSEDLFSHCTLGGTGSANDGCSSDLCNGAGACAYQTSGDGTCPACKTCAGTTSIACVSYPDLSKDSVGSATCTGTRTCCAGGSCSSGGKTKLETAGSIDGPGSCSAAWTTCIDRCPNGTKTADACCKKPDIYPPCAGTCDQSLSCSSSSTTTCPADSICTSYQCWCYVCPP
jgi:hypothetical protein